MWKNKRSTSVKHNGNGTKWTPFRSVIIRVINKIGRLTVLDKEMKIRESSSSNKWLSSVLLLSTQEAARAIWGLWENSFWVARAIWKIEFEIQFEIEKIYKCLFIPNCTKKMIWFRIIYIYIYIKSKKLTDSQSNASLGCRIKIWKFENLWAKQWPAF